MTETIPAIGNSYYIGNHQSTIDIASQILADEPVADDVRKEALYNRAKAYVAMSQYEQAIGDLTPLAKEVRTAIGAESKYLLADCRYRYRYRYKKWRLNRWYGQDDIATMVSERIAALDEKEREQVVEPESED